MGSQEDIQRLIKYACFPYEGKNEIEFVHSDKKIVGP